MEKKLLDRFGDSIDENTEHRLRRYIGTVYSAVEHTEELDEDNIIPRVKSTHKNARIYLSVRVTDNPNKSIQQLNTKLRQDTQSEESYTDSSDLPNISIKELATFRGQVEIRFVPFVIDKNTGRGMVIQ